jgi:hypothetical protein
LASTVGAGLITSFGQAALTDHSLTRRRIAAALLTIADLPPGYAKTNLNDSGDSPATSCPKIKDPFENGSTDNAEVALAGEHSDHSSFPAGRPVRPGQWSTQRRDS